MALCHTRSSFDSVATHSEATKGGTEAGAMYSAHGAFLQKSECSQEREQLQNRAIGKAKKVMSGDVIRGGPQLS